MKSAQIVCGAKAGLPGYRHSSRRLSVGVNLVTPFRRADVRRENSCRVSAMLHSGVRGYDRSLLSKEMLSLSSVASATTSFPHLEPDAFVASDSLFRISLKCPSWQLPTILAASASSDDLNPFRLHAQQTHMKAINIITL